MVFFKISYAKCSFAVLCLALALVYAGGTTSQLMNSLQHSGTQSAAHQHLALNDAPAMQDDQHADDDHADAGYDQAQDDMAGGHHHHGDAGPSLLATSANELTGVMLFGNLRARTGDRPVVGIAVPGPERPPMVLKLDA